MSKIIRWLLALALASGAGSASAALVLQKVAPDPLVIYAHGIDYLVTTGTGFGDVTAPLFAVDLLVPSSGGSTSGCEAADFGGFVLGSIALIQRGTCEFAEKVANAEAAGALAVLLFNEGNTAARSGLLNTQLLNYSASVPVFFATFAVGDELRGGVLDGATGNTVRMSVSAADIPEPASAALVLVAGVTLMLLARRRRSR